MILWSALILGLLGSTHCVVMCGPIVLALPLTSREKKEVILQSFLYHLGRVITYAVMGFFFGLMGWGIALAGYQKMFSIMLGVAFILSAVFTISRKYEILNFPFLEKYFRSLNHKLASLFSIKSRFSVFGIGLLNGLLPCGLVYIALVGAIATGNFFLGALYMLAFGFGTMPLMLGLMIFGKYSRSFFARLRTFIPYALLLFGVFMIYRGMHLEIPVELNFWESSNFQIMCH